MREVLAGQSAPRPPAIRAYELVLLLPEPGRADSSKVERPDSRAVFTQQTTPIALRIPIAIAIYNGRLRQLRQGRTGKEEE